MKVTADWVRHVALLARLDLEPTEEARFGRELEGILELVGKLRELDTEGVPPTSHAIADAVVFRDDVARNGSAVETILENAPDRFDDFFRVPKILE